MIAHAMTHEMIVAYGHSREIGSHNRLPWPYGTMSADMRHFRNLTSGKALIMGRKTFESLDAPLTSNMRTNIVVSSRRLSYNPSVTVVETLSQAYELAEHQQRRAIVIGGQMMYLAALPFTDTLYATEIAADFPDCDAHFPMLPLEEWAEADREHFPVRRGLNAHPMDFVTYQRIAPATISLPEPLLSASDHTPTPRRLSVRNGLRLWRTRRG
jgi:dihydrofolate reductase